MQLLSGNILTSKKKIGHKQKGTRLEPLRVCTYIYIYPEAPM